MAPKPLLFVEPRALELACGEGDSFPVRSDLSYDSLLSTVASILCMSACNRHCVTSCDQPLQAPSGSELSKRSEH